MPPPIEKTPHCFKSKGGFTLIEVLIALAIFSIGILAVGGMQISAIRANALARSLTEVTTMAADRMEKLIQLSSNDPALTAGIYTPSATSDGIDNNRNGIIDERGETGNMAISWTITDNGVLTNCKTIVVTITWIQVGKPNRFSLTCYKV
jgi:type IV pilus assembly protein PilV